MVKLFNILSDSADSHVLGETETVLLTMEYVVSVEAASDQSCLVTMINGKEYLLAHPVSELSNHLTILYNK